VKRLFLHAHRISFAHPIDRTKLRLVAPLPPDMGTFSESNFALSPDRL